MAHEFNSNPGGAVRPAAGVRRRRIRTRHHTRRIRRARTPRLRKCRRRINNNGPQGGHRLRRLPAGPRPPPLALGGNGGGRPRRGRNCLVAGHQPALGVGRGGAMVYRAVHRERTPGDPQADGDFRGARVHPGVHPGPHAAVRLTAARLGLLDLLLDLPFHAAAGADAALVQPGLPLREDQPGYPVHGRAVLRGADHHPDQSVRRGGPWPDTEPGRLLRRDHPRRHPLGRPGPARGRSRAGHSGLAAVHPDRPAASHARHPAHRLQRGDRPGQGHLDRLRPGLLRAVLHRPGHLQPDPAGLAAAAGGHPLVRRDHLGPERVPVLHRAALLQGRRPHAAPDAAAEGPQIPRPRMRPPPRKGAPDEHRPPEPPSRRGKFRHSRAPKTRAPPAAWSRSPRSANPSVPRKSSRASP